MPRAAGDAGAGAPGTTAAATAATVDTQSSRGYELCFVCRGAIVVPRDRVLVDGRYAAHAACFKCAACAKTLDAVAHDYDVFEGAYYCLPHWAWVREEARKQREREEADQGPETPARPGENVRWKMDWATKKWKTEKRPGAT